MVEEFDIDVLMERDVLTLLSDDGVVLDIGLTIGVEFGFALLAEEKEEGGSRRKVTRYQTLQN